MIADARAVSQPPAGEAATGRFGWAHLWLVAQMLVAGVVVYRFEIEGPAFLRVFALTAVGFLGNLALPRPIRLPWFVGVSMAGVFAVFGLVDGAWLLAVGGALMALCHWPSSHRARVIALLACGVALAVSRAGLVAAPWSPAVWPILGSMFMFRLLLYMMAVKAGQPDPQRGWGAAAYFFMLPNLTFPLFPVIDYQTFRRTHYDRDDVQIYTQGMQWIARGLAHLLLYRLVYHAVLNDPVDVVRLGDLVQFMVGTFLLYLRVSGQFHVIVGILHMFGFRMPETHKLYYLAQSFTELWRRINIYWTDFMMKTVFYPTYFRIKKLGPRRALVYSTTAVFVTTWLLHSYQWFWLRNGFPLTAQDTAFWAVLGGLVVYGALAELDAPRTERDRGGWSARRGLRAMRTFTAFCVLWSLWSTESVMQWIWMMGAAADVDVKGVVLVAVTCATIFVLGAKDWNAPVAARGGWLAAVSAPGVRTSLTLVVLLALAQIPVARTSGGLAAGLTAIHTTGLNARDAALNRRGYYEQLDVRGQLTDVVFDIVGARSANWESFASTGVLQERTGSVLTRDLAPSRHVVWNGKPLSTNQWGMRDREYPKEKAPSTLRIAMIGPSLLMGSGVADGENFESMLEARFARDFRAPGVDRVEILNFGVEGHTLPEQVAMLEDRVFDFQPDVVVAMIYHPTRAWTERYVRKLVWNGVPVANPDLRGLLAGTGVGEVDGGIAIPFPAARRLARWAGIDARMPSAESEARIRWVTDDVVEWSIRRFAEVTRARGVTPVLLALNAVIDDVPSDVPHLQVVRQAGLPLIDLFDVYPAADRAALRVSVYDEHPNVRGNQLVAEALYPQLVAFLESTVIPKR